MKLLSLCKAGGLWLRRMALRLAEPDSRDTTIVRLSASGLRLGQLNDGPARW